MQARYRELAIDDVYLVAKLVLDLSERRRGRSAERTLEVRELHQSDPGVGLAQCGRFFVVELQSVWLKRHRHLTLGVYPVLELLLRRPALLGTQQVRDWCAKLLEGAIADTTRIVLVPAGDFGV